MTSRQPNFDQVSGDGQNLLAVAHPKAVPVLQSKLQQLERKWVELRGHIGELRLVILLKPAVIIRIHSISDTDGSMS